MFLWPRLETSYSENCNSLWKKKKKHRWEIITDCLNTYETIQRIGDEHSTCVKADEILYETVAADSKYLNFVCSKEPGS